MMRRYNAGLVCTFACAGEIAALIVWRTFSLFSSLPGQHFFPGGILFALALIGATAVAEREQWINLKPPFWRGLVASLLAAISYPVATIAAVLTGFMSAKVGLYLLPRYMSAHIISVTYGAPTFGGLLIGVCAGVGVLAFALYLVSESWDQRAFKLLIIGGVVSVIIGVVLDAFWIHGLTTPTSASRIVNFFGILEGITQPTLAALSGYWLVRTAPNFQNASHED